MWFGSILQLLLVVLCFTHVYADHIKIINDEKQGYQVECCDGARCFGRVIVNGSGGVYDFRTDASSSVGPQCSIWYMGPSSPPVRFEAGKASMGDRTYQIKDEYLYVISKAGTQKYIKLSYKMKTPSK